MGKAIMFLVFLWVAVVLAGNVAMGSAAMVSTRLSAAVTATEDDTLTVRSTTGFPETGIIRIDDEKIGYARKTTTTFEQTDVLGVTTAPMIRGLSGTTAAAHSSGAIVRTVEGGVLNAALDYKIAVISDASGLMGFVTIPFHLLTALVTFFTIPIGFFGTDLAILSYLWAIVALGLAVAIGISLAGGRRV